MNRTKRKNRSVDAHACFICESECDFSYLQKMFRDSFCTCFFWAFVIWGNIPCFFSFPFLIFVL
ncbi:hypothetical protein BDZ91DRAFT_709859 [Kalaharituber pfeilii]|nr:hypothetical protein BDZ91DRAFT_709859 [Kalaharituber pfeilii]